MFNANTVCHKLPTINYLSGMAVEQGLKQVFKDGIVSKNNYYKVFRLPENNKLKQLGIESIEKMNHNIDGNGRQFSTISYLCDGFQNKDGLGVMFEPHQTEEIKNFFTWLNNCKSKGIAPTRSLAETTLNTKGSII